MVPNALPGWIAASYGFSRPVSCALLRSYTNDVYAIDAPEGRFVLKIYGRGWRSAAEIRYEVALIRHLQARGLPIAAPVENSLEDVVKELEIDGERRYAVLYDYASGEKPQPPFTPPLYHAFGHAVGRLHALSDDFVTEHRRAPLDLDLLIDQPLALATPLVAAAEDRRFLFDTAARLKERIAALAAEGLDWGPIHGDATLDNLHVTAAGEIILYDLDSAGPGWRAADLQGWAAGNREYQERWEAFQSGYATARPLRALDLQAAPYLDLAWSIWGLKVDLENRLLRQGPERTKEYLGEQVARLRERAGHRLRASSDPRGSS